jgi:charged multivesicular body protein 1
MGSYSSTEGETYISESHYPTNDFFNTTIQLRLTSRLLTKKSNNIGRKAKAKEKQIATYIRNNDTDRARITAEDAIRLKNESMRCLVLGSRVDGVISSLENVRNTQSVGLQLKSVSNLLEKSQSSMNLIQMTKIMDTFQQNLENLGLMESKINETIDKTTVHMTNENEILSLIQEVADEHQLELEEKLPNLIIGHKPQQQQQEKHLSSQKQVEKGKKKKEELTG